MTTYDLTVPVAAPSRPRFTTAGLVKVGVALALGLLLTVVILGTGQTGPEGDARLANPSPSGAVITDGVPRPTEPLWGVDNWPVVFGTAFLVVSVIVMAPFVLKSIRERRLSQGLMVFAAVAILATLDPIANWVTYTVYDPRLLHFPTTWTWMRFSPSVEPILVVPGYPFYYFSIALIAFGFGQRVLLPKLREGSWFRRHPRTFLFCVGFGMAAVWDVPTELLMIRANMYAYSQRFGPTLHWGGSHAGLPILWSLYTIVTIAAITPLLHRDDSGRSVMSAVAAKLPRLQRRPATTNQPTGQSAGRQILGASLVLAAVYLVLIGAGWLVRVSGVADNPIEGEWPYGEIKTYDPYGDLQESGVPGPYYR